MFDALVLDRPDGDLSVDLQGLDVDDLPDAGPEEVLVEVLYSSLNYKDGLAVTGAGKIIRGDIPSCRESISWAAFWRASGRRLIPATT